MSKISDNQTNKFDETANTREVIDLYKTHKKLFNLFLDKVESEFNCEPSLMTGVPTTIHSTKKRMKDEDHLQEKIKRKSQSGRSITKENLFKEVNDLAGLRILHLYQNQHKLIHDFIMRKVKNKSWKLVEKPIAYTWDPESVDFFKKQGIKTSVKPSHYTSVHYIIAPANESNDICCEIQVRTLFEEAWGEIDHAINYPKESESFAAKEQIRVLSKLVSTGSRLAEAIFAVHNNSERKANTQNPT